VVDNLVPQLSYTPKFLSVEPTRWTGYLAERRDREPDPRYAAMIGTLLEHVEAEQAVDFARFLRHQISEPVYRRFGAVEWQLPPDVRTWFGRMSAEGTFPKYELETERLMVGDDGLATDGILKMEAKGSQLLAHNMTLPDGGTEKDSFIVYRRFAIFISFQDGKMVGEDSYRDPPTVVKI
jgi:hypothetical protein